MRLDRLPGTEPLTETLDLAQLMVDGINRHLDARLEAVDAADAAGLTPEARRVELARRIGVVDSRVPVPALEWVETTDSPSLFARGPVFDVRSVRWRVLDGVDGEGLYLRPSAEPPATVICLGDADQTPEQLAGLDPDAPRALQLARRLAEAGCEVVAPVLVDREGTWAKGRPHREYVWRMAFEMGRHIIGYEVQRVLALVDHFAATGRRPIGVYGYGEGGLVALHAAALDPRIAAAAVAGHFRNRRGVWREPVYRDIWGLLRRGFGDAGIASLVAPRGLVVVACPGPTVEGPPSGLEVGSELSSGSLGDIPLDEVRQEVAAARRSFAAVGAASRLVLVDAADADASYGIPPLLQLLGVPDHAAAESLPPARIAAGVDPHLRQHRQFRQLCDFTHGLVAASAAQRQAHWAAADVSSPEAWNRTADPYRQHFHDEVLGRCPPPSLPPSPRSRRAYDGQGWTGYEVTLDLWPGVFAYGVLLLPDDLRPGRRRPVVVCQHGLEGRAQSVVAPRDDPFYRGFAAQLAERGFIVYSPQNPYIGGEAFRVIQRKAHPLHLSLFSFIIAQHARTLEWLGGQPWADPARIALYGLSYGGKTAMRVPAVLPGYCLSICSGDFNEWVLKCTYEEAISYLFTPDYDMFEFDLGHTYNYAEMAGMIAPRPFMVERGHHDPVGVDEWVAFEYAKIRRLYAALGIPERTEIEFFDGGHEINGRGTFAFLQRHLGDPRG